MTVKNHTDITAGAPAQASAFNTPLGQLDSAIADVEAQFNDFVILGGLAGVPAALTIAQPATRAFVLNTYVSVAAQNLTAIATSDNYIDLDLNGIYHVTAVANGAAAPAVYANAIRLYKAISNATAVTSIVDMRPQLTIKQAAFAGKPWIDITAQPYNADPTGALDSTTGIQNALNALPVTGGTAFGPAGTYKHSGLTPGSYLRLVGAGRGATVLSYTGTGAGIALPNNCSYAYLADMSLANTSTTATVRAITLLDGFSNICERLYIASNSPAVVGQKGIYILATNNAYWNRFTDIDLLNWDNAVHLDSTGAVGQANANFFGGIRFNNNTTSVHITKGQENIFTGVSFDGFANQTGIIIDGGAQATGNQFFARWEGGTNSTAFNIGAGVSLSILIGFDNCPNAPVDNGTGSLILTGTTTKIPATLTAALTIAAALQVNNASIIQNNAGNAYWDALGAAGTHTWRDNNAAAILAVLGSSGFLTTYGKAAVQGTGVPAIYAAPAPTIGATAAVASVATLTSPNDGNKHTYDVKGFVRITTLGSGNINLQVTYTDTNGTVQTCIIPLCAEAGTFATSATTADDYKGGLEITVNPNTTITIKTAGTFTGCTYNVGGNIKQIL